MTLGEKLRQARKEAGFSQQQLAEKLAVSRSAVAKWEADKGMPDVENLIAISRLLDISVDELLAEDIRLSLKKVKEPIDLSTYEKAGKCRSREDAAVLAKYAHAESIEPLIRKKKRSWREQVLDFLVQPGVLDVADQLENRDSYYLVEQNGRQYLVSVSKDFITSMELAQPIKGKNLL